MRVANFQQLLLFSPVQSRRVNPLNQQDTYSNNSINSLSKDSKSDFDNLLEISKTYWWFLVAALITVGSLTYFVVSSKNKVQFMQKEIDKGINYIKRETFQKVLQEKTNGLLSETEIQKVVSDITLINHYFPEQPLRKNFDSILKFQSALHKYFSDNLNQKIIDHLVAEAKS
jgi:hypothetical protein